MNPTSIKKNSFYSRFAAQQLNLLPPKARRPLPRINYLSAHWVSMFSYIVCSMGFSIFLNFAVSRYSTYDCLTFRRFVITYTYFQYAALFVTKLKISHSLSLPGVNIEQIASLSRSLSMSSSDTYPTSYGGEGP